MKNLTTEARHPVRVVAQRTGITPATLRAWERRYGVVEPGRSDGGQRLYSDADLERLAVLHQLTEGGRPIGLVAELSTEDAKALLAEDRQMSPAAEPALSDAAFGLVAEAMRRTKAMDAAALQSLLRRASVTVGARSFLDELVVPFLYEVGAAWRRGELDPAHEHLASEVVESSLAWLAESTVEVDEGPMLVVGTLPGEPHRLGARLVATAASLEGWRITYLGVDLPGLEIARAALVVGAAAVAVSAVSENADSPSSVKAFQELYAALPPDIPVLLGGRTARRLARAANLEGVAPMGDLAGLREALDRLR